MTPNSNNNYRKIDKKFLSILKLGGFIFYLSKFHSYIILKYYITSYCQLFSLSLFSVITLALI